MKLRSILFILVLCVGTLTGMQANTPDLKKNSIVEFVKADDVGVQFNVSVTKNQDVVADSSVKQEQLFVINDLRKLPYVAIVEQSVAVLWDSGGNLASQNTNTTYHRKTLTAPEPKTPYRCPRDGISCGQSQES